MDIEYDTNLSGDRPERMLLIKYASGRIEKHSYQQTRGGKKPKKIRDLIEQIQKLPTVEGYKIV